MKINLNLLLLALSFSLLTACYDDNDFLGTWRENSGNQTLVFKKYNNPKIPGNKNLPKASSIGFKSFKRYDIAGKDDPQTKIVIKR